MDELSRKTPLVFYRTETGNEVVRDWLRRLEQADRNAIGQDLMRLQFRWPVGMPLCRPLGDGLWEVRSNLLLHREPVGGPPRLHQEDAEDTCCRTGTRLQTNERVQEANKTVKDAEKEGGTMTKKPRSVKGFTTLDDFLESDGTRETFQAVAIKEVLAWQISEAMKTQGLSRRRLAERMGTSRSQIGRLLDPKDGNVTLVTLQKAAELLGRKVRLELV